MASLLSHDIGAVDMDFSAALVPKPTYLLVLHDFHARSPDELTLKKGERVELLLDDSDYGDGWYLGRSLTSNERGLFPEVYTTPIIVQDDEPPTPTQLSTSGTGNKEGTTVPLLPPSTPSSVPQGASAVSSTSPLMVDKAAKGRMSGTIDRAMFLVEDTGGSAMSPPTFGRSAVVEDTLSDIEEAISEISSRNKIIKNHNQRHSQAPRLPEPVPQEPDSGSEYSRDNDQIDSDSEAEDDDTPALMYRSSEVTYTVDEVSQWTPTAVANYLRSRGVSANTCDKFEEQEVTGSILIQLQMADLKELDLGSFGRRFEAWKEIENLVSNLQTTPKSRGSSSVRLSIASKEGSPRPRSSTIGAGILPRIQSQHNRPASRQNIPKQRIDVQGANAVMSLSSMQPPSTAHTFIAETPMSAIFERPRLPPESPPQVQNRQVRDFSSSYSTSMGLQSALATGASILAAGGAGSNTAHHRESSFDRNWKLTNVIQQSRPSTSTGPAHKANTSSGTTDSFTGDSGFGGSNYNTPMATEKSYFSGGESSTSKGQKVLQKNNTAGSEGGQRKTSYTEEQRVRAGTTLSRHSRIGSSDTVRGASSPSLTSQGKDKSRPKSNSFSDSGSYTFEYPRFSSSPAPLPTKRGVSDPPAQYTSAPAPIVTRSASEKIGSANTTAIVSPVITSPMSAKSAQDALHAKSSVAVTIEGGMKVRERISEGHTYKAAASQSELRKKSKKHNTSAWQEGLRNITPLEAAKEADFSGWMFKRGSGSVPRWGVRFFVLNGRRLSYFYNEDDTKERGLIDITSHKVLAAIGDRIVNFHASLAGLTKASSPASTATSPQFFQGLESPRNDGDISPKRSPLGPNSPLSPTENGEKEKERGWFTFKLVPPAPGAARGVMFTAPKLHYFATDTKETGRAWMAAIMKATIEIDSTQPVTSSYSAATISLAKARALRARPPDLAIIKPSNYSPDGSSVTDDSNKGLAITGISIDHNAENDQDNGDADVEENGDIPSRSGSRAGSHISTGTKGTGSEKKFGFGSEAMLSPPSKGFLGMSGAGDVRTLGSGSLRSPSLDKLLSGEEVAALNDIDG
ncbi:hypothetical protein EV426DRAFT_685523 [Tirmania nivea]|nr:hypothetical protein EV426DRAFT_685523 [Tirmania nivea]